MEGIARDRSAAEVLEHHRDTAERTVGQCAARLGARLLEALIDDGVELTVQFLDAVDRVVDELER